MEKMFEEALREKYRFNTTKGLLSVEQLYDLPLTGNTTNLDDLAKQLHKAIKETEETSFVKKETRKNTILKNKFDIVLHIINVKLKEQEEREKAIKRKEEKEKILKLIDEKQDEKLKNKDESELRKMLEDL